MTEWVLPPDETPVFTRLLEDGPRTRRPRGAIPARRLLAQLRGPLPRDQRAAQADAARLRQGGRDAGRADGLTALDHLYQGQSNDCYWHGLFGGIYIVHMRMATLAHLIAAEDLADSAAAAAGGRPYGARLADTDLDAIDEVLVTTPGQTVVVDLAEGAAISTWDLRASRVALGSVMRRRPEAYHERLVALERAAEAEALGAGTRRRRAAALRQPRGRSTTS